jgi:hypothetical protein
VAGAAGNRPGRWQLSSIRDTLTNMTVPVARSASFETGDPEASEPGSP